MPALQYFAHCKTKQDAKTTFKQLAKQYHPDVNPNTDTTATMQAIIAEYESIYKTLPSNKDDNSQYDNMSDEQFAAHVSQEMQNIISNISHLPITIEIIGAWLWVSGDTYKYKSYLTANDFLWSPTKKMYYWRLERDSMRGWKRKGKDIEEIRDTYGTTKVKNSERTYITA